MGAASTVHTPFGKSIAAGTCSRQAHAEAIARISCPSSIDARHSDEQHRRPEAVTLRRHRPDGLDPSPPGGLHRDQHSARGLYVGIVPGAAQASRYLKAELIAQASTCSPPKPQNGTGGSS